MRTDRAVPAAGAHAEASVLSRAIAHLEAAGLDVLVEDAGSADKTADAYVSIGVDGRQGRYRVQVRHRVSMESALAFPPSPGVRLLMVVPRVSDSVAEVWRANDVHFVDGAGNAYVRQPGEMPAEHASQPRRERAVADYIAGMTDRFALREHQRLTGRVLFAKAA